MNNVSKSISSGYVASDVGATDFWHCGGGKRCQHPTSWRWAPVRAL